MSRVWNPISIGSCVGVLSTLEEVGRDVYIESITTWKKLHSTWLSTQRMRRLLEWWPWEGKSI